MRNERPEEGKSRSLPLKEKIFNIGPSFSVNLEIKENRETDVGKVGEQLNQSELTRDPTFTAQYQKVNHAT